MEDGKKFYWLKLKKDFFKRHDIRIIEGTPNGTEICLFYLKLMLESVDHDGKLRFSDKIPYTPEMLSVITWTELDIVEEGIDVLESLDLLSRDKDGTYILPMVVTMIDSASDSDGARRMRRLREQKANNLCEQTEQSVTDGRTKGDESIEIRDKSIEIRDKRNIKEKTPSRFTPPSVEEVRTYCQERGNSVDPEAFVAFYDSKGWKVGNSPMKNWKSAVVTWEKRNKPEPKKSGNEFLDLLEKWEGDDEQE